MIHEGCMMRGVYRHADHGRFRCDGCGGEYHVSGVDQHSPSAPQVHSTWSARFQVRPDHAPAPRRVEQNYDRQRIARRLHVDG